MFCIHCGAECPEDATFCLKCGKQIKTSDQSVLLAQSARSQSELAIQTPAPNAWWRLEIGTSAKWIRRVAIPLAILVWIGLVAVILWAAAHVARSLLLLAIAAILAFALAPVVKIFERIMPRLVAIFVVYIIILSIISVVIYFLFRTAILQVSALKNEVTSLLTPKAGRPPTSLEATLHSFGIDQAQIQGARQSIVSHLGGFINDAVPLLRSVFDFVLDVFLVAMLGIYFLLDGSRVMRWLRNNLPLPYQKRGFFLLDTLENVVGGYIRGQLLLSLFIGLLVGGGMAVFQVPHPILLGELAFLLAFVPLLGTFISAAACILLALTQTQGWVIGLTHQSWLLAVIVLIYFVMVHLMESHIVGPRIVGHAVGLHPIIAISALIAGTELFGILGALFITPLVGVFQVVIASLWREWRANHPDQFPKAESAVSSEPDHPSVEPAP